MNPISPSAIAKTKEKSTVNTASAGSRAGGRTADLEMSKVGLVAILAVGGVIGVLGLLFLLGGLMSAGNPLNFVSQWVQAVLGR